MVGLLKCEENPFFGFYEMRTARIALAISWLQKPKPCRQRYDSGGVYVDP